MRNVQSLHMLHAWRVLHGYNNVVCSMHFFCATFTENINLPDLHQVELPKVWKLLSWPPYFRPKVQRPPSQQFSSHLSCWSFNSWSHGQSLAVHQTILNFLLLIFPIVKTSRIQLSTVGDGVHLKFPSAGYWDISHFAAVSVWTNLDIPASAIQALPSGPKTVLLSACRFE